MTKKVLLLVVSILMLGYSYAQKAQRIAYIDMEYILENIPDYQNAQSQLTTKVSKWQAKIIKKQREIEVLKTDLGNEKALLTQNLIQEREEDIAIKAEELKKIQNKYFGTEGDLYELRKQLVKPVQDQIYNSVQEIAKKRKYDFVLDKSSDLIMLYTNDRFDISDMVIKSITRGEKQEEIKAKRAKRNNKKAKVERELSPEAEEKAEERDLKKKELQEKIESQKAERKKQREKRQKEIAEKREARLKEREEQKKKIEEERKARLEKAKGTVDEKNNTVPKENEEKTIEKGAEKGAEKVKTVEKDVKNEATELRPEDTRKIENKARIEERKIEREKKRAEQKKKIEETRAKRLKERKEAQERLKEKRENQGNGKDESKPEQQDPE